MKKKGKFFAAMLAVALILCLVTVALAACGDKNTQKHEHTFAEEWSHNDDYHWHAATCGHTDQVQDKASHDFDWQEVTPASCDQKGRKKGTCECGYVTYEDIEMTAHTLTPGWTWSGYTSATLKLTCTECEDVIATVPATLSSESGSDACAEYTLHTATATYDGETYTNSKREESVSHHTYALSEWKWDDDLSGAVAVLVCERDATHVYESARVSSEENDHLDPTCTENGYTDYKVRLELDGATYEGTKQNGGIQRKEIDTLGHDFDTEWLHNASEHWHKCSRCTETDAHIAHTYTDGICACGYAELTPEDEFVFSEIDGKWAITGYRGNRSVVTIPATYRGRDVVELGMGAFYGNTSLKHVVIPDAITSMRDGVFDGCVNIEEVTSPAIDLSSIPKDNLKKLTITSGTRIEAEAFKDYTQLAELSIAETVTYIGKDAFANTAWLNDKDGIVYINKILYTYIGETPENFELTIEDDTVAISPFAFEGKSIYQITISNDVFVAADAFKDTGIQRAILSPDALTSALSAIPKETLRYLEITNGTTISQGALKDCVYLEELVLPFVGGNANASEASESTRFGYLFASVKPILNVDLYYEARQLYWNANSTSNLYVTYYIPKSIRIVTINGGILWYGAFSNCSYINTVTIGAGISSIGSKAFYGCTGLRKINIGEDVTYVGDEAFYDCYITKVDVTSLKAWFGIEWYNTTNLLYMMNRVTIGTADLYLNGEKLTEVKDLDGVSSIPANAFYGCVDITSVTIPSNVSQIGQNAFYGLYKLVHIRNLSHATIESIAKIDVEFLTTKDAEFQNKLEKDENGIWTYTVDDTVYAIGYDGTDTNLDLSLNSKINAIYPYAFSYRTDITSVTISDGVTSIGDYAFRNCTGLQTVNWNATNCTKAGSSSNPIFSDCTLFRKINIGENVQSIPGYAFLGCTDITYVTIPDSMTSIGEYAFYNCKSLIEITISDNVQSIGNWAFGNCTRIQTATINAQSIGSSAFRGCTGLQTVTINAQSIGEYAFRGCTGLQTVTIGVCVQSIGSQAFYESTGITKVNVISLKTWCEIDSSTSIGSTPLYAAKDAKLYVNDKEVTGNVIIPSGTSKIGNYAFYHIYKTSITIPDSVQSIGREAFPNNGNLIKIYYEGDETLWNEIKKDSYWNSYYSNGKYYTNKHELHYNSTGPEAASAASNILASSSEQSVLIAYDKLDLWAKQN